MSSPGFDDPRHLEYQEWLERAANGIESFGLSLMVASGFLRCVIATGQRSCTH
ncbi:MAG: hypothetical protein ACRDRH_06260 [Pseudonocardia sp.]